MSCVDTLKKRIDTGDLSGFKSDLDGLVLISLGSEERLILLITLLSYAIEKGKLTLIQPLLEKWNGDYDDEVIPTIGDLVATPLCPPNVIEMILDYCNVSPMEVVESRLLDSNGDDTIYVCDRLRKLFPNSLGIEELSYLETVSENIGNQDIISYFHTHPVFRKNIKRPLWVSIREGETNDLLQPETWEGYVHPEGDNISDIFEQVEMKGKVDPQVIEHICAIAKSVVPVKTDAFKDPDRVFGPLNRFSDNRDCVSGIVKGGCRMLTCRCRDFDVDGFDFEDNEPFGWFEGACDGCEKKIEDPSHCLRFPIYGGGWVGCYCSIECIREFPPRIPDQLSEFLLDASLQTIESKGIVDYTSF